MISLDQDNEFQLSDKKLRLELEPATCGDPQCDADHGFSGTAASDDLSLRFSAAADGPDAVQRALDFAEALSKATG